MSNARDFQSSTDRHPSIPPGYKQTEVGVIPEDWEVKSVHEFAAIKTGPFGTLLKASEYTGTDGVPLISVGEIREGFLRVTDHTPLVSDAVIRRLPQYVLKKGDIVFGRKGGVERSALIRQQQEGWFLGSDGISIRPSQDCHDEYLALQFQSARIQGWLLQHAIGTTMPSLNQEILRGAVIPLPPTKAEQEAIAEALSDVNALIESLEQLIAKKRQIKQGAMQELLTGEKRLPGFNGKWESKRIGEIASPCSEKSISTEGLPVLACSKHLGFVDSLSYFKNQVFSKDTSTYKIIRKGQIGYPANHIEEGSIGLQDLYEVALVSPIYVVFSVGDGVDSFFLHRILKLDSYRVRFKAATTSSVDRRGSLRWPAFSEITVMLPDLSEQIAIAAILSDMDEEIATREDLLAKARQIKHGIMQELLTGKTRLIDHAEVLPEHPLMRREDVAISKPEKIHNWAFHEAVVISMLTAQFAKLEFPLGRKRYTKLSYLLHRKVEQAAPGYLKKAAGPYNPKTKYAGPEKIAQENCYVRHHENGKFKGYIAGERIDQAKDYFVKWYGSEISAWLEKFRYKKNDELERLATVDMAIIELLKQGSAVDVAGIRALIASEPEWVPKLERPVFSDSGIAAALAECRTLFEY